uniref:Uncharacterized protein n=1 Tax=Anopheles farauti TaxID=69004 RepID=A0A182R0H8_9DIPT
MCAFSWFESLNFWSHISHSYGFSPVCTRRCRRRLATCTNWRSQCVQEYGFSPVCSRMTCLYPNERLQILHVNTLSRDGSRDATDEQDVEEDVLLMPLEVVVVIVVGSSTLPFDWGDEPDVATGNRGQSDRQINDKSSPLPREELERRWNDQEFLVQHLENLASISTGKWHEGTLGDVGGDQWMHNGVVLGACATSIDTMINIF